MVLLSILRLKRFLNFVLWCFFHGWGGTESCSTLGSCSGLGISAWGLISEYWKVAVPQGRGLVPLLPSELRNEQELGFHLSQCQLPGLQDHSSVCYVRMWGSRSKDWSPKAEWSLMPQSVAVKNQFWSLQYPEETSGAFPNVFAEQQCDIQPCPRGISQPNPSFAVAKSKFSHQISKVLLLLL